MFSTPPSFLRKRKRTQRSNNNNQQQQKQQRKNEHLLNLKAIKIVWHIGAGSLDVYNNDPKMGLVAYRSMAYRLRCAV